MCVSYRISSDPTSRVSKKQRDKHNTVTSLVTIAQRTRKSIDKDVSLLRLISQKVRTDPSPCLTSPSAPTDDASYEAFVHIDFREIDPGHVETVGDDAA